MGMAPWDPFADISRLQEQVNRLFEQRLLRPGRELAAAPSWTPAVDIYATEQAIVVHLDLPGVQREDIDIQLTGETLTIKGVRRFAREETDRQYMRIERPYGAFLRSFTLGIPIDQHNMKATYSDGVLEVILPKVGKPQHVKIEVETEEET